MQLGREFIYKSNLFISSKNTKTSDTLAWNKKRENQALIKAFQDLLQIDLDIFKELDFDKLIPNTTIQNKAKAISRMKNLIELV